MQYIKKKESEIFSEKGNWFYSFEPGNRKPILTEKHWGDWPAPGDYAGIHSLTFSLRSSEAAKVTKLPDFIGQLKNLRSLGLPIDLLPEIADQIPAGLESLRLFAPLRGYDHLSWPDSLHLKKLQFIAVPELLKEYKLPVTNLPEISWLDYDLQADKKGGIVASLAAFKKVTSLELAHAKNLDVFTPFKDHHIQHLTLFACTGKNFPIANIKLFPELKWVRINNIAPALDCSLFLELPHLEEIDLLNIKQVVNIGALLKHPALKRLSVSDCKQAFQDTSKEAFKQKGFEYLNIDYA